MIHPPCGRPGSVFDGAGGGNRTHTTRGSGDFESPASTNFTTPATDNFWRHLVVPECDSTRHGEASQRHHPLIPLSVVAASRGTTRNSPLPRSGAGGRCTFQITRRPRRRIETGGASSSAMTSALRSPARQVSSGRRHGRLPRERAPFRIREGEVFAGSAARGATFGVHSALFRPADRNGGDSGAGFSLSPVVKPPSSILRRSFHMVEGTLPAGAPTGSPAHPTAGSGAGFAALPGDSAPFEGEPAGELFFEAAGFFFFLRKTNQ